MKRIAFLLAGCCFFGGCTASGDTSQASVESAAASSESTVASVEPIDIDTLSADSGQYAPETNEIVYYTEDEVKEILRSCAYFDIADSFSCAVPQSVSYVSSFVMSYSPRQENASFYRDFLTMFRYLFPDETFCEDYMFYYGENSGISYDENDQLIDNVKLVSEAYDSLMSGEEKITYLFYSPHFRSSQTSTAERNIFMEFTSPICNDLSNFNKGVLAEYYCEQNGIENTDFLETLSAPYYYTAVQSTSPDSTAEYPLLDGVTLPINQAVAFFEDYINTLPYPESPVMNIKVVSVDVLQCAENTYCYYFTTTKQYDGILFDWTTQNETRIGQYDYDFTLCFGSMAVSDDVDQAYGIPRSAVISDEIHYTDIIPFERALEIVHDSLSDRVSFTIYGAELVYTPKQADAAVQVEDYQRQTTAAWKITLYNPRDGFYYVCYTDATDGGNFRYYRISSGSDGTE